MKKIKITLLLLATAFVAVSQTKNFIDQPYIETNARVDTSVTPDDIYLAITISEKDTKGKISVEKLEIKMIARLKDIGIDTDKQLKITDLSSDFKKYFLKQKDVLKAKSYSLLVHTGLDAGKVLVELEDLNISNVRIERTEYSKMEELTLRLKSKAVEKAKQVALALAAPLGQEVGNAIYISDQSGYGNYYAQPVAAIQLRGVADKKEYTPADIEFQKIKVENTVAVKFVLK